MSTTTVNLLLADDDLDDCIFFKEALAEISVTTKLTTVNDGVQLMNLLSKASVAMPDALFLDLNMPRKNGLECLTEIKQLPKMKQLPIIIFSTSFDIKVVNLLRERGADYYICKPAEFSNLKKIIAQSLNLIAQFAIEERFTNKFVITPA